MIGNDPGSILTSDKALGLKRKVFFWSCSQHPPKHRYKSAGAIISDFHRYGCDRLAVSQADQAFQQPRLLLPLAERESRFREKEPR